MARNPNYVPNINGFGEVADEPIDLTDADFELSADQANRRDLRTQSAILTENGKRKKIQALREVGLSTDDTLDVLSIFMPNCTIGTLKSGLRGELLPVPGMKPRS